MVACRLRVDISGDHVENTVGVLDLLSQRGAAKLAMDVFSVFLDIKSELGVGGANGEEADHTQSQSFHLRR